MAHELDQTAGKVSFADSRTDAWHQLGQQVGHAMTAREALHAAHLANWNVRKMALVVPQEPVISETGVTTPAPLAVPDQWATVRTNPITGALDVLGVVGNKYERNQYQRPRRAVRTQNTAAGSVPSRRPSRVGLLNLLREIRPVG
jgi:hypothetical protein